MEHIKSSSKFGGVWYYNIAPRVVKEAQKKNGTYKSPLHHAIEKRPKNNVVLSIDSKSKNNYYKYFGSLPLNKLNQYFKDNIHAYEILPSKTPVKMYFDVDITKMVSEENNELIKNLVIKLITNEGISDKDILIFAGRGKTGDGIKQSYHFVVNDKYFRSMDDLCMFKNYIQYIIYTEDEYTPLRHNVLDFNVYKKNQAFKLPYQTKGGKNIKQIPITGEHSLSDMLVGHYNDLEIDYYSTLKFREFSKTNHRVIKCANNTKVKVNFALGSIIECLIKCFPKGYKLNLDCDVSNDYKYYLKSIPNNKQVPRNVWKIIGYCISTITKNSEDGLREWVKWSLPYDNNTTATSIKDEFMSHSINKGYGYKTLYTIAKIFNPKITNPPTSMDYLFDDEAPFEVKQNTINNRYIECDEFNMSQTLNENDVVFIKSPMGTGKSWTLKRIFGKYKSILYLSCKRAFASAMFQEFKNNGFINYDDVIPKSNIKNHDKIICSVESIQHCRDKYDLVIIDESESIADNLTGEMFKKNNPIQGATTMYDIIYNSNKHLVMDAFISQRSFKFIADILETKTKNIYYLKNMFQYKQRKYLEYTKKNAFIYAIKTDLDAGKRVVVVCGSKNLANQIVNECKKYDINYYHSGKKLNLNVKVNEEWKNCNLLLYTPTITAGISYDNEEYPFDKLYIYSVNKGSTHFRNIIQAHKRVRHFNDNTIGILFSEGYKFNDDHIPIKMDEIIALEYQHKSTLFGEDTKFLLQCEKMEYIYNIFIHNKLEANISQVQHKDFAKRYLREENIVNVISGGESDIIIPPYMEKIIYKSIPKINTQTRDDLVVALQEGDNDEDDRMKVLKYNYENCYIHEELDKTITEEVFERFYKTRHHTKFNNVREFKTIVYKGVYEDDTILPPQLEKDSDNPQEFKSNKYKAFDIIGEFFKELGVMSEGNLNPLYEFNSGDFNKCLEFLKPYSIKGINTLMKDNYVNIKSSDKGLTTRNIHTIFNCLLKEFFGMEVKTLGDKWTKVEGKKKKLKKYNINNYTPPQPNEKASKQEREEYYEAIKFANDKYNQMIIMNENPSIENDKSIEEELNLDFIQDEVDVEEIAIEEPPPKKIKFKVKNQFAKDLNAILNIDKPKCPTCNNNLSFGCCNNISFNGHQFK